MVVSLLLMGQNSPNRTHQSPKTYLPDVPMNDNAGFIPPHGNYRELLSYRKAEIVQIRRLERDFVQSGGLRERMTRARRQHRDGTEA